MKNSSDVRRARLDRSLNGILALIGIQFFLGMWLNLFGNFPTGSRNLGTALTFTADPILIAHIIIAIFLMIESVFLVLRAWSDPMRSLRWFSLGGFGGLIFAAITGSGFVYSGYSSGVDSFLMSVGFAIALTAYYEGLIQLRADRMVRPPAAPVPTSA